jgi:4-amino-4-deoxy-L-arabinose transferase-like glycosyltransferase
MAGHRRPAASELGGALAALDPFAPGDARARLLALAVLLALSALPLAFLAPLFTAPFDPDQGGYATIARGWLDGAIPYRDLWDNKGPMLFLWYAASFKWLGESVVAPRVAAAVAAGLSVPFVWASTRTLIGRREAVLAAGLFALSFGDVYLQVTANSEVFMLLPLTAGLWAFAVGARGGGLWWFLAAGALTSLAMFTRQSALWTLLAYGAWLGILFLREPDERRRQVQALAALILGAVLATVPFVAYFAAHGALYDLWYAMFAFNWVWAGEFPIIAKLLPPILLDPTPLVGGLVFWALAAVGVWRLWLRGDRFAWLVILFLLSTEAAAQTLGKTSPHYSVQLLPGAAVAAGVGLPYVWERWRQGHRRLGMGMLAATVVMVAAAVFVYTRPTSADRFEVQYRFRDYAQDAIEAPAIAEAVDAMTQPGDYVYEWGRESEIYFLADRQPASRWLHNRPYKVDKSIMTEVIGDLEEKRPTVILLTFEADEYEGARYGPPPELGAYLARHYDYVGQVQEADLYKLREE